MLSVINIISYTSVIITALWGIRIICFMCQSIRHFAFLVKRVLQKGCLWLRSMRDCLVCHGHAPVPEAGPMFMPVAPLLLQCLVLAHLGLTCGESFQVGGAVCYHFGGSCHKYHFCRDKIHLLSRQKYACREKTFVATKLCLSWQNIFVATKRLSQIFVTTNVFVTTKVLWWQAYFCRDKRHVLSWQICVCHNKSKLFVTKVLSQQNYVCCDKSFVATKMMLVAAPTNDTL